MKLILSAQRSDAEITYAVDGDNFLINGNAIDLSGDWVKLEGDMPEGLLAGERNPNTGEITLTVRAPHRANAPESERFPEPIELADGQSVTFPREVEDA